MGQSASQRQDELKNKVIKLMYVAGHEYTTVTAQKHKEMILLIFSIIKQVPNPTTTTVIDILRLVTMNTLTLTATNTNNGQLTLPMLQQTLANEKINDIRNYFQAVEDYFKNTYPHVTTDKSKIDQLHHRIVPLETYCATLWNVMKSKDQIPMDPFWFYITGIRIHLLFIEELINLGDLNQTSYKNHITDYCEKITTLKSKIVEPNQLREKRDVSVLAELNVKSHDGKWYKILRTDMYGVDRQYKDDSEFIRNYVQEYYDELMEKPIKDIIKALEDPDSILRVNDKRRMEL